MPLSKDESFLYNIHENKIANAKPEKLLEATFDIGLALIMIFDDGFFTVWNGLETVSYSGSKIWSISFLLITKSSTEH